MKNFKFILLSMILVLSLALSGCSGDSEYTAEDSYTDNGDSEYNDDFYFEGDYETVPQEILDKTFTLSADDATAFKNAVSSLKVSFEKISDTDIKKCLAAYNSLKTETPPASNSLIKNRKVAFADLLASVEKNNAAFNDNYYSKMSADMLKKTVTYITEAVNHQLSANPYIDLNLLDANLKKLKVLYYSNLGYGVYNYNENVLAINRDYEFTAEEYRQNATHETNHLVQHSIITKDDSLEMCAGVCYKFENIELNYLMWTWYFEGVAQANILNQLDMKADEGMTYDGYVYDLQCLNAALALTDEDVYKLYYATTQSDLKFFFDLFDCKTEQDKIEIVKLMSAIALTEENEGHLSNVFYDKTKANDDANFTKRLSASAAKVISKVFYKNLAEKIENNTVKLADVFSLISSFESYLSGVCWYDSFEYSAVNSDFYKDYCYIQDEFFRLVSAGVGLETEELYKYYADFHHTTDHAKYENSLLSKEQGEFYKKIYGRTYFSLPLTVNEAKTQLGS